MKKDDLSFLKIEKSEISISKKNSRKAILFLLSIFLILFLLGYLFYTKPYEIEISSVSYIYPFQRYSFLSASGYVVAEKKASVGVKTTGTLEWLGVQEGSVVKKGQLIGRLENRDLIAALQQVIANFELQKANLRQAEAELNDARLHFDRNSELFKRGFISRAEFDTSEARLKKAEAFLESQRAAVKAAEAMVKSAEINLDYTFIRAPFDGVVLTKDADVGDIVTPLGAATNARASIVTIADLNSLQVEVDVSEQNIKNVKEGQICVIELDAFTEKRFRGKVIKIIPTADRTKASVRVRISFIERTDGILPDMSAKVTFTNAQLTPSDLSPVIGINSSSVLKKGDKYIVYVVNGERLEERDVVIGDKFDEIFLEVHKGLSIGEQVVLYPSKRLKSGIKIRIKK